MIVLTRVLNDVAKPAVIVKEAAPIIVPVNVKRPVRLIAQTIALPLAKVL